MAKQTRKKPQKRLNKGLKDMMDVPAERTEEVDRRALEGLDVDEVQRFIRSPDKLTKKEFETLTADVRRIYDDIETYRAKGKTAIILKLMKIYAKRDVILDEIFDEDLAKRYTKSFAQFMIEQCGAVKTTAYMDVQMVQGFIDYPDALKKLKAKNVKNFLRKWKEMQSLAHPEKLKAIADMESISLKQIAELKGRKNRAKYVVVPKMAKTRTMLKKGGLDVKSTNTEYLKKLQRLINRLSLAELDELLKRK